MDLDLSFTDSNRDDVYTDLTLIILSITTQVNDAIDKILSSRQTTCLIVAHRLSTIARAERIVVLEGTYVLLHYNAFVFFFGGGSSPPI